MDPISKAWVKTELGELSKVMLKAGLEYAKKKNLPIEFGIAALQLSEFSLKLNQHEEKSDEDCMILLEQCLQEKTEQLWNELLSSHHS